MLFFIAITKGILSQIKLKPRIRAYGGPRISEHMQLLFSLPLSPSSFPHSLHPLHTKQLF